MEVSSSQNEVHSQSLTSKGGEDEVNLCCVSPNMTRDESRYSRRSGGAYCRQSYTLSNLKSIRTPLHASSLDPSGAESQCRRPLPIKPRGRRLVLAPSSVNEGLKRVDECVIKHKNILQQYDWITKKSLSMKSGRLQSCTSACRTSNQDLMMKAPTTSMKQNASFMCPNVRSISRFTHMREKANIRDLSNGGESYFAMAQSVSWKLTSEIPNDVWPRQNGNGPLSGLVSRTCNLYPRRQVLRLSESPTRTSNNESNEIHDVSKLDDTTLQSSVKACCIDKKLSFSQGSDYHLTIHAKTENVQATSYPASFQGTHSDKSDASRRSIIDPYSAIARVFISERQVDFLTKGREHPLTSTDIPAPPYVWLIDYFGECKSRMVKKASPGWHLSIVSACETYRKTSSQSQLLGHIILGDQSVPAEKPIQMTDVVRFDKLLGRGGTSSVFAATISRNLTPYGHELCQPITYPAVVKILHHKHWKCALTELVATAASILRFSQASNSAITSSSLPIRHSVAGKYTNPVPYRSSSPSTSATNCDTTLVDVPTCLEGGMWLLPSEAHLFWNSVTPTSATQNQFSAQKLESRIIDDALPTLCCLITRNLTQGVPLLSWLNNVFVARRLKPSHELCVYVSYILVSLLRQLHSCGIIHGDIKPDNFLLFSSEVVFPWKDIFQKLQRTNLLLSQIAEPHPPVWIAGIDFGRSLDVVDTLRDVTFIGDTQVSDFRCPAMIERKAWEAQIDLTGLAVTIYTIITLKYPKIRRKPNSCNKSYWFGSKIRSNSQQNAFWITFLDQLINFAPDADGHTLRASCRLLTCLEEDLCNLFLQPHSSDSQAKLTLLQGDLTGLQKFIKSHHL